MLLLKLIFVRQSYVFYLNKRMIVFNFCRSSLFALLEVEIYKVFNS
jgi:hypothetical protein